MDKRHEGRMRLADAMNTYNHALAALEARGYAVYLEPDEREDHLGSFWAIQEQRDFIASDPLRLLGLVAMWELFGNQWHSTATQDIYGRVINASIPCSGYSDLSDAQFDELVSNLSPFLHAMGVEVSSSITRQELADLMANLDQAMEKQQEWEPDTLEGEGEDSPGKVPG